MILVQMTVRIMQLGDGPGGSYMTGQNQAENPGYTSSQTYGEVPSAQYAEFRVGELVPGGDAPTSGNFTTVFTTLAADAVTMMSQTPNPYNGSAQTLVALVDGWSTGNP